MRSFLLLTLTTTILFVFIDFIFTKSWGIRGFSKFFQSNEIAGRTNKPNFDGIFGGPLHEFNAKVTIGGLGQRLSTAPKCKNHFREVLFLGDSFMAGFEVNNEETFVSRINDSCKYHGSIGINFGVRAHDTHSVLGTYRHIAKHFTHTDVFYLIAPGDFSENLDPHAYKQMTNHFGRVFNGKLMKVDKSILQDLYYKLRIFVSDNFYFSTNLIQIIQKYIIAKIIHATTLNPSENTTIDQKLQIDTEINKMTSLLSQLEARVKSNGAKLTVGLYPCLEDKQTLCKKDYEKLIIKALPIHSTITVIPIVKIIKKLSQKKCINIDSMSFKKDGHLSQYGHKVFSHLLRKHLLEDQNYNKQLICPY